MSNDMSGMNLKEPEQMDWENFNPTSSKFQAPPPSIGADGKPIVYQVQLPNDMGSPTRKGATQEGYRKFECGPLTVVKTGNGSDGYQIKYYTVSVTKFKDKKTGEPINVSSAGKLIRAAGIPAKPQTNAEYEAAMAKTAGRVVPVTIEWVAKGKDTGEEIIGEQNFPIDPTTGRRKAILKAGDVLPSGQTVKAEVIFANARVKYVQDGKK